MHKFVILNKGIIETYSIFEDIPRSFDNLIEFSPETIPPPHTEEEHRLNAQWDGKLKHLMDRETK